MITIKYKPRFLRESKKFSEQLMQDLERAIALFVKNPQDPSLRTHRLKGSLKDFYSFSMNYKYRIVFEWSGKNTAILHMVGNHSVYE